METSQFFLSIVPNEMIDHILKFFVEDDKNVSALICVEKKMKQLIQIFFRLESTQFLKDFSINSIQPFKTSTQIINRHRTYYRIFIQNTGNLHEDDYIIMTKYFKIHRLAHKKDLEILREALFSRQ